MCMYVTTTINLPTFQVASQADTIVTMLPNNSIVTNVYQVTHAKHFRLDNAFSETSMKKSAGVEPDIF